MWIEQDTTTHQDHVIAHVIESTILGYFSFDESIYLLLDIGFIWRIYLDGEMGLLPWQVTIEELDSGSELKQQLKSDCELLLHEGFESAELKKIKLAPDAGRLERVTFFVDEDKRLLILDGEERELAVETSLETRKLQMRIAK